MVELSASAIILEYICPGCGVLIGNTMFSAPYRDLQRAIARGEIGTLNPTPWAFMLGNCFGWVVYGILTENLFIFWGNAPGFLLSVYLNLGAVKLLYQRHHSTEMRKSIVTYLSNQQGSSSSSSSSSKQLLGTAGLDPLVLVSEQPLVSSTTTRLDQLVESSSEEQPVPSNTTNDTNTNTPTTITANKDDRHWATVVWNVTSQSTPAPAPHETLVLSIVTIWTICMSLLGFAASLDSQTRELIVGTLVNLNLVFFYGAPLSTIYTVLRESNSSSIHTWTMTMNTLNGTFWFAYGLAVLDPIVYVPNGLGTLLGVVQIILVVLYPREEAVAATSLSMARPEDQGGENGQVGNKAS
jgi:solute carrier family 50 protein (sugar transporter)